MHAHDKKMIEPNNTNILYIDMVDRFVSLQNRAQLLIQMFNMRIVNDLKTQWFFFSSFVDVIRFGERVKLHFFPKYKRNNRTTWLRIA